VPSVRTLGILLQIELEFRGRLLILPRRFQRIARDYVCVGQTLMRQAVDQQGVTGGLLESVELEFGIGSVVEGPGISGFNGQRLVEK